MIFREKLVSSERIYDGAILNMRRDTVTVKNGKTATRDIVEHNGAVAMVVLTDGNEIILERQYRHAMRDVMLEIPAGKIDKGETDPVAAARRELREETGYAAESIRYIGKIFPSVAYSEEGLYLYLCTGLTEGETEMDEDEDIEIVRIPFDEACRMAEDGKIGDSKSVCGILMVKGLIEREKKSLAIE